MTKNYLVVGTWIDKTSGKPISSIVEISRGTNKQGNPYEIANTDNREAPIEGTYPVGTVLTANMELSVQPATEQAEQRGLKLPAKQ